MTTEKTGSWPYQIFTRDQYQTGLVSAGVTAKDNVRSACEKLLSVVVGTHEAIVELRGPDRKYLGKQRVLYKYGIPYELIEEYLADNFPKFTTTYHSLRWYMVRMREQAGQTTSQKDMDPKKLEQLKIQGMGTLPERRERARKTKEV